jgi:hypothetical protein
MRFTSRSKFTITGVNHRIYEIYGSADDNSQNKQFVVVVYLTYKT